MVVRVLEMLPLWSRVPRDGRKPARLSNAPMTAEEKMADRTYDVEITITKTVRVRVPDDVLIGSNSDPEEAAEEFALGGKSSWPDYVLTESEDHDIESVRLVR